MEQPKIFRYDTVDSTNTVCKSLAAQGAPSGTAVIARRQTAGRGRMGRSFESPEGLGLYLSVLWRPEGTPEDLLPLTPMAAVSAAGAIRRVTGAPVRIKWPNDLVLEGRKLAGILTEASLSGRGVDHVVIGIGVNLRQRSDDFSPEVARIATSLEAQGYPADRAALETALAEALCQAFGHLHTPEVYAADYRRLCLNLGQTLRIPDTGETVTALDIDRQYGLVVRRRDGTVDTLRCGEVSVRGLYGYVYQMTDRRISPVGGALFLWFCTSIPLGTFVILHKLLKL